MDCNIDRPRTFKNPLYNDWKFGATVNTSLIKPIPDFIKTEEERAKFIRFEMDMTSTIAKFAQEARKYDADLLFRATKNTRKHIIFISVPHASCIAKYVRDLVDALYRKGLYDVRVSIPQATVETEYVIAEFVSPTRPRDGLRCDECFGFTYEEAKRLKRSPYPGFNELTSVPGYIKKYETKRKEQEKMYENCTASEILHNILKNAGPEIRPLSAKPTIEDVIFNDPATIVMWSDGTKTVVKAENEPYDPEKGLAMAISKKNLGNKHDYYITFKKYLKKYYKNHPEKQNKMEDYRPAAKAYSALVAVALTKGTKADLEAAITEAIGYLGEALSE